MPQDTTSPATHVQMTRFRRPVVEPLGGGYSLVVPSASKTPDGHILADLVLIKTDDVPTDLSWPECSCGARYWVSFGNAPRDDYDAWSCATCGAGMLVPSPTKRQTVSYLVRGAIIERFNRTCHYCKRSSGSLLADAEGQPWNIDHKMPLALGGSNDETNLVLSCTHCNHTKSAQHPDEFHP